MPDMKLEARGIRRDFFRNNSESNFFSAVEKTDFVLEEGRLTEIIGRSGSGKTTFINMLCGLLSPTEGQLLIDGSDFYAMTDDARSLLRNRKIGIIPQERAGLSSLTVLENVLAPAAMYGDMNEKKERALELLKLVGIADLANVFSNELSGGELRRMSIARALINEPEILIADEPTGDLDDETTETVLRLFKNCAERGMSVLMVTHELSALPYADYVYKMDKGILQVCSV